MAMTYEDAKNLKSFKNYCTCGGYAGLSERAKSRHPHLEWCPQLQEWEAWKTAMEAGADIHAGDGGYREVSLKTPEFLETQARWSDIISNGGMDPRK